jgi:hypothetical protein
MTVDPQVNAEEILVSFKTILMNEDTECGNEILCTYIAKECSLLLIKKIKESREDDPSFDDSLLQSSSEYSSLHPMFLSYWNKVEEHIKTT